MSPSRLLLTASIFVIVSAALMPFVVRADRGVAPLAAPMSTGDHAIYVRASGAYPGDGVVLPVFEALEARYAAANKEFTVEYWFKLPAGYNSQGKELVDHHRPSNEGFWTAFQDGMLWAGIDTQPAHDEAAIHVQTGSGFDDGQWHHYALARDLDAQPHQLCLYLDGVGSCYTDGSTPGWSPVASDIRPSRNRDGDDTNNLPLYVIGSRTSGAGAIEATIDELRISDIARYRGTFTPQAVPFVLDQNTVMLFHFDEGSGNTTIGLDSNGNRITGTLVSDVGNYGVDAPPMTDATWLSQMWVDGRFGTTPSSLMLISPNGGQLWKTNHPYPIEWSSSGTSISHVNLSYSTDGFSSVSHTIAVSVPNTGIYTWTTPITPSSSVRVRVADALRPAFYADSAGDFILTDAIFPVYLPIILKD